MCMCDSCVAQCKEWNVNHMVVSAKTEQVGRSDGPLFEVFELARIDCQGVEAVVAQLASRMTTGSTTGSKQS